MLVLTEYSKVITANASPSYAADVVTRAGGKNAATVDGTVGIEQVLAWNPDVILLTHFETKRPIDLVNDPLWSKTAAARNKRVYKLPFGVTRWGGYGPESPLMLAWLAQLLHPAQFTLPLRSEMRAAYKALYNYTLTDADIDRVLQMDENGPMANYTQFKRAPAK